MVGSRAAALVRIGVCVCVCVCDVRQTTMVELSSKQYIVQIDKPNRICMYVSITS